MTYSGITLQPGEKVITVVSARTDSAFSSASATLTNYRIVSVENSGGFDQDGTMHSIDLENIDSISSRTVTPIWALVPGFALIVFHFIFVNYLAPKDKDNWVFWPIELVVWAICIYRYSKVTPEKFVQVISANSTMELEGKGLDVAGMNKLVSLIDNTRLKRKQGLGKPGKESSNIGVTDIGSSSGELSKRLESLQAAHKGGLISKDEFDKKRASILEEL